MCTVMFYKTYITPGKLCSAFNLRWLTKCFITGLYRRQHQIQQITSDQTKNLNFKCVTYKFLVFYQLSVKIFISTQLPLLNILVNK